MHSYDEMSTCRSETYTTRQHVTSTSQSVPQFRDQTVRVVQQSRMRDKASCEYGQIVGGTCGCSTDNPANVNSVVIAKCTKDIRGHLRSPDVRDASVHSESNLLLARAGMYDADYSQTE